MPEGQFSGNRKTYEYDMDDGTTILISVDQTLAEAPGVGLTAATAATTAQPTRFPRFKPRGVYWQGVLGGKLRKKFLPCAEDSTLYTKNTSVELTVDGVDGRTTGRRGERLSFYALDEEAAP